MGKVFGIKALVQRLGELWRTYDRWVRCYDSLTGRDREAIAAHLERFKYRPQISLILPAVDDDPKLLRASILSVSRQLYANWELCIAVDSSVDPRVERVLADLVKLDSRIKREFRAESGSLSATVNTALEHASGEFVAFLRQNDELAEHALYCVVAALQHSPGMDILYGDEDEIDSQGKRKNPQFKPEWNIELVRSVNYVGRLGVYRRTLIADIGGFREGLEGHQDHDLLLRCAEKSSSDRILHLPEILHHERLVAGQATAGVEREDPGFNTGLKAVADVLGHSATVEAGSVRGTYRVRYRLPEPIPTVTIIIPSRDNPLYLRRCVESLKKLTDYPAYRVLVVDNGSVTAEMLECLAELAGGGDTILSYPGVFNFAAMMNWAVAQAQGEVVVLLNDDTEIIEGGWLRELASHAVRPNVGAVGVKLIFPAGQVQHGGIILGLRNVADHAHKGIPREAPGYLHRLQVAQNVSAVTAACLAVRRDHYLAVNGMDAEHLPVVYNDVDFCLRLIDCGLHNVWTPHAVLVHHESMSRGGRKRSSEKQDLRRQADWMRARWDAVLKSDPAYNLCLSLSGPDFELAWPPRRVRPWAADTGKGSSKPAGGGNNR